MKKILIGMIALISLSGFAQTTDISASGKVRGRLFWNYDRTEKGFRYFNSSRDVKVSTKLKYSIWGEGKIRGVLIFKGVSHCEIDKAVSFVGIDNGFGGFDLHRSTDSVVTGEKFASLIKFKKDVTIDLSTEKDLNFSEYDNKCSLVIIKDSSIDLKVK